MDLDLSKFIVVQEDQNSLILQRDDQLYIYKEFRMPQQIGFTQLIDQEFVIGYFEKRKCIEGMGVLKIEKVVCTRSDQDEPRVGILFESYSNNFDEELSLRRGTDNHWTEEELFNTFQACLQGLKTFHESNYVHGAIGPQSIIFSQDGLVKIADHFVVGGELRRNWSTELEYGQWPPEVIIDWNVEKGWCEIYESFEGDLWALGLVFLESMILQASFEIYYANDDDRSINIDSNSLAQKLQLASTIYSPYLVGLVEVLLSLDPCDRVWSKLDDFLTQADKQNNSVEAIANSLGQVQLYIEREDDQFRRLSNNESQQLSYHHTKMTDQSLLEQDITISTKTKLNEMLESCLQKSKDLVFQNQTRNKQNPNLNSQSDNQTTLMSQESKQLLSIKINEQSVNKTNTCNTNVQLDDLFQKSLQRSRQVLEKKQRAPSTGSQASRRNTSSNNLQGSKENIQDKSKTYDDPKLKKTTKGVTKIDYESNFTFIGYVSGQPEVQKEGFGSLYQKDSRDILYQGDWQGDNFHGTGLLQNFAFEKGSVDCNPEDFSNISKIWRNYQGEFLDGLMSGKGQLTFADGSLFQGSFLQGAIDGFGMYMKGGQVLIGQWNQNQLTQLFSSTF